MYLFGSVEQSVNPEDLWEFGSVSSYINLGKVNLTLFDVLIAYSYRVELRDFQEPLKL